MTKRKKTTEVIVQESQTPAIVEEATVPSSNLKGKLEEIRRLEGVRGYIARDETSAIVNLEDKTKITDYALFASSIFETSKELSKSFNLNEPKEMVVEGADAKVLSIMIDGNRVSIFAGKNVESEKILRNLRAF